MARRNKRAPVIPCTLTDKYLIEKSFQDKGPVRFVTYNGFTDAYVKSVEGDNINLSKVGTLKKINVLLAFPKIKMPIVKNGVKRRRSIASKGYTVVKSKKKIPYVDVRTKREDTVKCILRNGLEVTGKTVVFTKHYLILRVGYKQDERGKTDTKGKIVIVYRHGLLEFKVLKSEDDWDEID